MASTGKKAKGKKPKGKTLNLNEFLSGEDAGKAGPGSSYVLANKPVSWADEMDSQDADVGEDMFGSSRSSVNRSLLPTAPRSALSADIDLTRVPTRPPFTAFLGNLPFDVDEAEIERFFGKLEVSNIRFPQDQGRSKGFGYAEFEDRQALVEALGMNDGLLRGRNIRIDLAEGNQGGEGGSGRRGGDFGNRDYDDDRTDCNWRKKEDSRPDDRDQERGGSRYGDRYGGDRDGYGSRGGGGGGGGNRYGRQDDNTSRFASRDIRYYPEHGNDRDRERERDRDPVSDSVSDWRSTMSKGSYDDRRGGSGYDDRRGGGYDDRRSGYDDRRGGGYDDRRGGYDDRRGGGYDDRRGGGYDDRRGGYDDRRGGGYDDRRGGGSYDDRRGGYDNRRGYDDNRDDRYGGGRRAFGSGYGRDGDRDGGRDGYRDAPRDGYRDSPRDSYRPPPRDDGYRRDDDRDGGSRDGPDAAPVERPKLKLQPRSKPKEEVGKTEKQTSSIFGAAKPVDTAAREREIEDRLLNLRRQDDQQERHESEVRDRQRTVSSGSDKGKSRRDSNSSLDGGSGQRRERKSSSSSGKGIRTVAPPPGSGSARVRRDSALSDEEVFEEDKSRSKDLKKVSSPPPKKDGETPVKLVPAPAPKDNPWVKKSPTSQSPSQSPPEAKPEAKRGERRKSSESDRRSGSESDGRVRRDSDRAHQKEVSSPPAKPTEFSPAGPPKENIWEKRKQQAQHPSDKSPQPTGNSSSNAWSKKPPGSGPPRDGAPAGFGRGRGGGAGPNKPAGKREKPLPKSIEEMPKYEENHSKDFSDANKFSFLMEDEDTEDREEEQEEQQPVVVKEERNHVEVKKVEVSIKDVPDQ